MPEPAAMVPLGPEALAQWRGAIEKARQDRKTVAAWWDANLRCYAPLPSDNPDTYGQQLNTNRDFTLVERKKADLFYQRPDVSAVPSPLMVGAEAILDTHTNILNEKLGLDGVNAKALVHQVLFDVLCPAGTGWTVMGYESVTVDTPTTDPITRQPMMAKVPVFEDCFWRHLSPRQILRPREARATAVDDWPWVGWEFEMPIRLAKRKGWVPENFTGAPPPQDTRFQYGLGSAADEAVAHGVMIYYKSALYRDDRVHPQHQTRLVLIEGADQPAEHTDSPLQTLDRNGRLTPDSLIGFPIHALTIRTLTDSAVVPSDCTVSRPLVNELNKFRGQMVEQRDSQLIVGVYNTDTLPPEAVTKMVKSRINGLVGVPGAAFVGEGPIKPLERSPYPRENFTTNDYLDNDLARTHGLDSNQQGVQSGDAQTATEAQLTQSNVNARLGFERGNVLDWYIKGVTKFSTVLQRYLPVQDAAAIVGVEAAQAWDQWRKAVPASLAFTAMPDSALRNDLASERKRKMDNYSYWANDPYINRPQLLKETVPALGYSMKVINPQPPEKGPEPTKPGLSFKGEDLNPLSPQFPIVLETLSQCGIKISPQAIQQAQEAAANQVLMQQVAARASAQPGAGPETAHGGKVAPQESLSKHAADLTGGMQGSGAEAPMGAGGMVE